MGKYMRQAKNTGDFALMEVAPKSSFGVRTRAKTLALQRLQSPSPRPDDSFSFLQLRSRRLEKFLPSVMKPKEADRSTPNPNPKLNSDCEIDPCSPLADDAEVEVSIGENMLEVEEMNRKVRETTPTNLIRNSEDIVTPGSSTRPSNTTANNSRSSVHMNIPTTREMEEFFKAAEQSQMKLFTEKYNYDPVNDCPLLGRYEWVKLG